MKKPRFLFSLFFAAASTIHALTTSYFEGENFTAQSGGCAASAANFPYIGTGYLDLGGNGSWAEFNNITVPAAGTYTLILKYANGSGANRPCDLAVNGATVKTIPFTSVFSGDWTRYWNARVTVNLNSGANTLRLTAMSANGGPNIDNIGVSSNGHLAPPAPVFNVKTYGARGDGTTSDRTAIQNAINACTAGGSVVLDSGTFMSGQLILKSNMTLWISETATLKAIQDTNLYPETIPATDNVCVWIAGKNPSGGYELKRAFLYANRVSNLTITGGGVIDGNDNFAPWNSANENGRPIPVYITQSTNITLSNFDIVRGAMWNVIPLECDTVFIDGLNFNSPNIQNRDGIDICDSHDVTITNCAILAGDDAICPKTGSTKGVDNLVVRNVTVNYSYASGIKLGTLSYGSFTNSTLEDIAVKSARVVVGLESVDGADVNNITCSRMKGDSTRTCAFIVLGAGIRNHKPASQPSKFGSMSNILIQDIECRNTVSNYGSSVLGTIRNSVTYRPRNITLRNITVTPFRGGATTVPANPAEYAGQYPEYDMHGMLPAWGYYVRHVADIRLINCSETVSPSDVRPARVFVDTIITPVSTIGGYELPFVRYSDIGGSQRAQVYSLSGRLVGTWLSGICPAGKNGGFQHRAVSEGIYLVRPVEGEKNVKKTTGTGLLAR